MKADGILQVTEALRERLEASAGSSDVPGTVFVGPLDDADASGAALILFLYRIVPNASSAQSRASRAVEQPPPPIVFQNSLPLDLYYLVTVGTVPDSSEETPLRALGFAIQAMQADPDLTGPA